MHARHELNIKRVVPRCKSVNSSACITRGLGRFAMARGWWGRESCCAGFPMLLVSDTYSLQPPMLEFGGGRSMTRQYDDVLLSSYARFALRSLFTNHAAVILTRQVLQPCTNYEPRVWATLQTTSLKSCECWLGLHTTLPSPHLPLS